MDAPKVSCSNCKTSTNLSQLLPLRCGCLLCSSCTTQPVSSALISAAHHHVMHTLHKLYPTGHVLKFIDLAGRVASGKVLQVHWDGIELTSCMLDLELSMDTIASVGYWQILPSMQKSENLNLLEEEIIPRIECPGRCKEGLLDRQDMLAICPNEVAMWEDALLQASLLRDGFIRCPNVSCGALVERLQCGVVGSEDQRVSRRPGMCSKNASDYREKYRYRCSRCTKDFCGVCLCTPYHEGYTCSEAKKPSCQFCHGKLVNSQLLDDMSTKAMKRMVEEHGIDTSRFLDKSELLKACSLTFSVCNRDECRSKLSSFCNKELSCGHRCCGVRGETDCPPCIEPACSSSSLATQDCPICWDNLQMGPCIQILCGHVFHLECIRDRIKRGFPGPQISFNFMNCPLCGDSEQHHNGGMQIATVRPALEHALLHNEIMPILDLKSKVVKLVKARIKLRHCMKTTEELQPGGKFEGRPVDFALSKYIYFQCHKCGSPYFGGDRVCENAHANNRGYNPEELVCGSCAAIESGNNCPKHGTSAIEWKCKFCCSIASWFCWGTTHMCDSCHAKCVTGTPMQKVCTCVRECPLHVRHPPPGQEFCLGCALCRYKDAT